MRSMKRFFAITLLVVMASLGTPAVFADGNAESPGYTSTQTTTTDGNAESPGYTTDGNAESPGFYDTTIIYLDALI